MVLFFDDVFFEVGNQDRCNGIVIKRGCAITRYAHQRNSTLHHSMELHQKRRHKLRQVWMCPEPIARSVESGLCQTDFAPEKFAV